MAWHELILACGALTFAAMVQASVGFGAGMVSIPLLLWIGVDIEHTLALMSATVGGQLSIKLWRYRHEIDWRAVLYPMGVARAIGYAPGFYLLYLLAGRPAAVAKQAIGVMILLTLMLQVGLRVKPREHLHAGWAWLAGITGGLTAGAVGMGGPPLVLWVVAHDWPGRRARLYLWASFWLTMPLQLVVLVLMFRPREQLYYMGVGVATLPVVLLGLSAGLWIGHRMPRRQLRWAMITLLVVLGVTSIVGPLV